MGEYVARARDMARRDTTPSEVPDVLAADLRIVFVGINPGRVSAAAGAISRMRGTTSGVSCTLPG
jgi:hypothetical protein